MNRLFVALLLGFAAVVCVLWIAPRDRPQTATQQPTLTPRSNVAADPTALPTDHSAQVAELPEVQPRRVPINDHATAFPVVRIQVVDAVTKRGIPAAELLCFPPAATLSSASSTGLAFDDLRGAGRWDRILARSGTRYLADSHGFADIEISWNRALAPREWRGCPEIIARTSDHYGEGDVTAVGASRQIEVREDYSLDVVVVDETGNPVQGVSVHLVGRPNKLERARTAIGGVKTDARGAARFGRLRPFLDCCREQRLSIRPWLPGVELPETPVELTELPTTIRLQVPNTGTVEVELEFEHMAHLPASAMAELAPVDAELGTRRIRNTSHFAGPRTAASFIVPLSQSWTASLLDQGRRLLPSSIQGPSIARTRVAHRIDANRIPSICFELCDPSGETLPRTVVRLRLSFSTGASLARAATTNGAAKAALFFAAGDLEHLESIAIATASSASVASGGQSARIANVSAPRTGGLDLGIVKLVDDPLLARGHLVDREGAPQPITSLAFRSLDQSAKRLLLGYRLSGRGRFRVYGVLEHDAFELVISHAAGSQREILSVGTMDASIVMQG